MPALALAGSCRERIGNMIKKQKCWVGDWASGYPEFWFLILASRLLGQSICIEEAAALCINKL